MRVANDIDYRAKPEAKNKIGRAAWPAQCEGPNWPLNFISVERSAPFVPTGGPALPVGA